MVVDAVLREPISVARSLLNRENTGNFAENGDGWRRLEAQCTVIAPKFPGIPYVPEQGII
jgi:hypothetical protein